jgi:hypothetical protein
MGVRDICLGVLVVAGCGPAPTTLPGTGSREAVRTFFEALVRRDWAAAYEQFDADSRAHCDRDAFARRATSYLQTLGFEPERVHVRACDEQGDGALAHVILLGADEVRQRFKDAVPLRREASGWAVVLPPAFGQSRR